jgi:hypothetical protein
MVIIKMFFNIGSAGNPVIFFTEKITFNLIHGSTSRTSEYLTSNLLRPRFFKKKKKKPYDVDKREEKETLNLPSPSKHVLCFVLDARRNKYNMASCFFGTI